MHIQRERDFLAGVIEGEGCFCLNQKKPALTVQITDGDIAHRLAAAFGGKVYGPYERGARRKPIYQWWLYEPKALRRAARLIRPLLGTRRRSKMDELLVQ